MPDTFPGEWGLTLFLIFLVGFFALWMHRLWGKALERLRSATHRRVVWNPNLRVVHEESELEARRRTL